MPSRKAGGAGEVAPRAAPTPRPRAALTPPAAAAAPAKVARLGGGGAPRARGVLRYLGGARLARVSPRVVLPAPLGHPRAAGEASEPGAPPPAMMAARASLVGGRRRGGDEGGGGAVPTTSVRWPASGASAVATAAARRPN